MEDKRRETTGGQGTNDDDAGSDKGESMSSLSIATPFGVGGAALVEASLPLPGAAPVLPLRSISKGPPTAAPVASQLTTPPSGGVAAASSSGLSAV